MTRNNRNSWWTALCLGVVAALSLQAAPAMAAQAGQEHEQAGQEQMRELTGKVSEIDTDAQSFKVEGIEAEVVVTGGTQYSAGLTFAGLKSGDEVRVVGTMRPDGKFEAREIHREGGAPPDQQ